MIARTESIHSQCFDDRVEHDSSSNERRYNGSGILLHRAVIRGEGLQELRLLALVQKRSGPEIPSLPPDEIADVNKDENPENDPSGFGKGKAGPVSRIRQHVPCDHDVNDDRDHEAAPDDDRCPALIHQKLSKFGSDRCLHRILLPQVFCSCLAIANRVAGTQSSGGEGVKDCDAGESDSVMTKRRLSGK